MNADEQGGASGRRVALLLVICVALVFVVQLVALATGHLALAGACGVVFIAAWFALRSWQRRSGRP